MDLNVGKVPTADGYVKSQVTFSDAARAPLGTKEMMSFNSAASDDGESDIDDVPDAPMLANEVESLGKGKLKTLSDRIDLAAFFQSDKYRTLSLLFGPILCFFFVA